MRSARPSAAAIGLFACLAEGPLIPSFIRTFECMHIHVLHANVRVKEQSKQWRTQKLVHTSIIQAQLCAAEQGTDRFAHEFVLMGGRNAALGQLELQNLVSRSPMQHFQVLNSPDPEFLESAREDSGINISQPTSSLWMADSEHVSR